MGMGNSIDTGSYVYRGHRHDDLHEEKEGQPGAGICTAGNEEVRERNGAAAV